MYNIDEIVLDFEPRKKILPKLPIVPNEPEMTEFESAFLCGVLNKFKPKKILEVGVAADGTTAVIMQCMEDLAKESRGGGMKCIRWILLLLILLIKANQPDLWQKKQKKL